MMQDRSGPDSDHLVPGTWYLAPVPHSHLSNLNRALLWGSGTGYRVPAIWHLGPGTRHRSRSDAEGRTPSTEDRARLPENAHTGYA
jgi:hypothetical protein